MEVEKPNSSFKLIDKKKSMKSNNPYKNLTKRIVAGIQRKKLNQTFFMYPKRLCQYHDLSFAQEGEDRVLSRFFEGKGNGFYIDVGAHHPQRFSNTYYFYLCGWRGINIDPMPGRMQVFNEIRPDDINLEIAVSDIGEILTYYEFNETALNGFSKKLATERDGLHSYKIVASYPIQTRRLDEILDEYLPDGQEIDFLSVDVEGLDLQVLKSNDWNKYRPDIVLAESLSTDSIDDLLHSDVCAYMSSCGYHLYSRLFFTMIFKRNE
jgi:FkbM family methyltransferase